MADGFRLTDRAKAAGCAGKLGPADLAGILSGLDLPTHPDLLVGTGTSDDAGVFRIAPDLALVQTVDFFPAFTDDPYLLGEIAANHGLNDVFAMGGTPRHALAIVVVPPGPASKVEEELFQLLSGAKACLEREDVALIGGHSSEGDLAIGFSITGEVAPDRIVRKAGLKAVGHRKAYYRRSEGPPADAIVMRLSLTADGLTSGG